jgi:hypothetical protein
MMANRVMNLFKSILYCLNEQEKLVETGYSDD